jgi:hypothetical protein
VDIFWCELGVMLKDFLPREPFSKPIQNDGYIDSGAFYTGLPAADLWVNTDSFQEIIVIHTRSPYLKGQFSSF